MASPLPSPPPIGEGIDALRLKRLRYRSWHRGTKETDLVLGNFADAQLQTLDDAQLGIYERLLEENDVDIWDWLTGAACPAADYAPLVEQLKQYGLPAE